MMMVNDHIVKIMMTVNDHIVKIMMTVTDFQDDGNCIPKLRVMVFVQFLLFHVKARSDQNR